jgi:hypothetical protein
MVALVERLRRGEGDDEEASAWLEALEYHDPAWPRRSPTTRAGSGGR